MATEQEQTRDRLRRKLNTEITQRLIKYDQYFEGSQPLRFLAPALKEELGDRLAEVVINWYALVVEAYEHRLDVEGFRFPDQETNDDALWRIWQYNDADLLSQQVNQESLALGRAYMIVGPGEENEAPLITAESPFDTIHEDDPKTKEVRHGLHQWTELDGSRWVSLYGALGERTTWMRPKRGGDWKVDSTDDGGQGLCRVVPFVNQPRMLGRLRPGNSDQRLGRAEPHSVMSIADAANKMATDMMISGEFHAMPRRWAFGMKESDFEDSDGNPINAWSMVAGRMWANEDKDVKVGQFKEADLTNFHNTIKLLAQITAQLSALPPHYLGFTGDNPASADAIRSAESQLVKRAERKQSILGNRYERVQRLVMAFRDGKPDDRSRQIETKWRDASTPTISQKADATVKLVTAKDGQGRSVLPVPQAREDLGYTAEQRKRMSVMDEQGSDAALAAAVQLAVETERANNPV